MKFPNLLIRIKASSLLESVIALSIVSICIFISVLIVSTVYNNSTSPRFYESRNKAQVLFFMYQIYSDSITDDFDKDIQIVNKEYINATTELIEIKTRDSTKINNRIKFYVNPN